MRITRSSSTSGVALSVRWSDKPASPSRSYRATVRTVVQGTQPISRAAPVQLRPAATFWSSSDVDPGIGVGTLAIKPARPPSGGAAQSGPWLYRGTSLSSGFTTDTPVAQVRAHFFKRDLQLINWESRKVS